MVVSRRPRVQFVSLTKTPGKAARQILLGWPRPGRRFPSAVTPAEQGAVLSTTATPTATADNTPPLHLRARFNSPSVQSSQISPPSREKERKNRDPAVGPAGDPSATEESSADRRGDAMPRIAGEKTGRCWCAHVTGHFPPPSSTWRWMRACNHDARRRFQPPRVPPTATGDRSPPR